MMAEGPEGFPALPARLAGESLFPEKLDLVFALRHFVLRTDGGP